MSSNYVYGAIALLFSGPFVLWPKLLLGVMAAMRDDRSGRLISRNTGRAFPVCVACFFVGGVAAFSGGLGDSIQGDMFMSCGILGISTMVLLVAPWPRWRPAQEATQDVVTRPVAGAGPYRVVADLPPGTVTASREPTGPERPPPDCRIVLHRRTGLRAGVLAHSVWIDGVRIGKVKDGQTLTVPVLPGRHTVEVTLNRLSSPVAEVELLRGQDAVLRIVPGDGPMTQRLPDQYIALEFENAVQSWDPAP